MSDLANINWALVAPLIVVQVILMIIALVDLVKIHATNGPKWMWAIMIVVINLVGPVLYFIIGRKSE